MLAEFGCLCCNWTRIQTKQAERSQTSISRAVFIKSLNSRRSKREKYLWTVAVRSYLEKMDHFIVEFRELQFFPKLSAFHFNSN